MPRELTAFKGFSLRATVVVLGDLSRSPRIVLHALALDGTGADVDLVGFAEPSWRPTGASTRLRVHTLPASDSSADGATYAGRAVARGMALLWRLSRTLWTLPPADLVLVQNPPGVPTLAVAWVIARLRRARFAIDWHNLTWSMLALRLGNRHALVRCTSAYERFFSRRADVNLFVSSAMAAALSAAWQIRGHVFRDRPGAAFLPLDSPGRASYRRSFLERLSEQEGTSLLAVSSTSWSADEDFELLYDALVGYEKAMASAVDPPVRLVMVITGRGPFREPFERRLAGARLQHVAVHTLWLEAEEYPRLLASADIGISLHRSASGLDLPMKVLDMFGAGLPVCALDYGPCLRELVVEGQNGLLFSTGDELATLLANLSRDASGTLAKLRENVLRGQPPSWESAWRNEVHAVFVEPGRI